VVQQLNQAIGQRVQLHYTEHKGVPTTCFGETQFYVDAVQLTERPIAAPAPAPVPAVPAPQAATPAAPAPATQTPEPAPAQPMR
jgi:hypothetical protein